MRLQPLEADGCRAMARNSRPELRQPMCWCCSSATARAWITSRACSATCRRTRLNSSSMATRCASIAQGRRLDLLPRASARSDAEPRLHRAWPLRTAGKRRHGAAARTASLQHDDRRGRRARLAAGRYLPGRLLGRQARVPERHGAGIAALDAAGRAARRRARRPPNMASRAAINRRTAGRSTLSVADANVASSAGDAAGNSTKASRSAAAPKLVYRLPAGFRGSARSRGSTRPPAPAATCGWKSMATTVRCSKPTSPATSRRSRSISISRASSD